ncbi:MAG: hypothetical protein IKS45_08225 [Thermoguttaceae bacterium]|nr:hypothetical protein [Thermoguttaceae bacterium]
MSFLYIRAYLSVVDDNRCSISIYSRFLIALFVLGIGLTASVVIKGLSQSFDVPSILDFDGAPVAVNGSLESVPRDFKLQSQDSIEPYRIPINNTALNTGELRYGVNRPFPELSGCTMDKDYPSGALKMSANDEKPSLPLGSGGISEEDFLKLGYRRHTTVNGDKLDILAERYLHDSSRWGEIYNLNSNQLTNKDVVPIGIVLIIPAK